MSCRLRAQMFQQNIIVNEIIIQFKRMKTRVYAALEEVDDGEGYGGPSALGGNISGFELYLGLVAPHDLMTPSAVRRRRALLTYLYEIDI
jgi:hypothetical protein